MRLVAVNFEKWQPTNEEYEVALSKVKNQEERTRIGKFIFERDRKSALLGRLLIQNLVEDVSAKNEVAKAYSLHRTKQGKPFVRANELYRVHPLFNFNISHHGEYVVMGHHEKFLIGVDVMRIENRHGSDEAFYRNFTDCFTRKEWQSIRMPRPSPHSFSMHSRGIAEFYTNWTLKEAYIKAVGIGLGFPLQDIEFSEVCSSEAQEGEDLLRFFVAKVKGKLLKDYRFATAKLDDLHVVSTCLMPYNEALTSYKRELEDANGPINVIDIENDLDEIDGSFTIEILDVKDVLSGRI